MEEDIKKLLEKNLALAEETQEMVKGIRNYVRWQKAWGWIKFFVIIVPLILTLIYLPPLLSNLINQYQELLGISGNTQSISSLFSGGGIELKK